MQSLILRTLAPFLTALMLVFSIFILLRGHNAPGGGFIGGLIAASAFAIHGIAFGVEAVRRTLRIHPLTLAGLGLLTALISGLVSVIYRVPFLTGLWFSLPLLGDKLDISTVQFFDLGVYLVVLGAFAAILLALEEREDS
jgi:multicomponent Na+:H+ antiporter subunit B